MRGQEGPTRGGPMKRRFTLAAILLCLAARAHAQTGGVYSLAWSTFDGGGQTAVSGGVYQLGGTAGQPDAGSFAGGVYAVNGGFWGAATGAAVAVPVAIVPTAFAARPPQPNP